MRCGGILQRFISTVRTAPPATVAHTFAQAVTAIELTNVVEGSYRVVLPLARHRAGPRVGVGVGVEELLEAGPALTLACRDTCGRQSAPRVDALISSLGIAEVM